jgi:hypothetical protein
MRQQQTQIDLGIHGITLGNWCRAVFEHAHRAACPTSQESPNCPGGGLFFQPKRTQPGPTNTNQQIITDPTTSELYNLHYGSNLLL